MKHFTLSATLLVFSLGYLFTMDTVLAQSQIGGSSNCEKTAKQMRQSCTFDIHDDFLETKANCINIADAGERRACEDEARTSRREAFEVCAAQHEARLEACEILGEDRYDPDPLLDPAIEFVNPDDINGDTVNPYVSLIPGHTFVIQAGEEAEETVVVNVTKESREISGVLCRVVVDIVVVAEEDDEDGGVDYVPVEVTDDWFAQDVDSNVYYCGEVARNYEDGVLVDIDGSFEAGKDFAKAGTLIKASPLVGDAHRQEFALGEAEDIIQYVDSTAIPAEENPAFPVPQAAVSRHSILRLSPLSLPEYK
ncbi:MAG: hypothetical protein R3F37_04940 [Candidatus Competibacteraceae bacterium]